METTRADEESLEPICVFGVPLSSTAGMPMAPLLARCGCRVPTADAS